MTFRKLVGGGEGVVCLPREVHQNFQGNSYQPSLYMRITYIWSRLGKLWNFFKGPPVILISRLWESLLMGNMSSEKLVKQTPLEYKPDFSVLFTKITLVPRMSDTWWALSKSCLAVS